MDLNDVIAKIEKDVRAGKEIGQQSIDIDKMLSYLEQLKLSAGAELETARFRAQFAHERQQAYCNDLNQKSADMFKSVLETGGSAIKSVILINGGAAVGLLTFLGNLAGKEKVGGLVVALGSCLQWFGWGVLAGALGMGFRYASQSNYGRSLYINIALAIANSGKENPDPIPKNKFDERGSIFEIASFASTALSYILFGIGLWQTASAFLCYAR